MSHQTVLTTVGHVILGHIDMGLLALASVEQYAAKSKSTAGKHLT